MLVKDAGRFVVEDARHRTDAAGRERPERRDRVLAHFGEITSLEVALERDPVLPRAIEFAAEYDAEVVGVIARAARIAAQPPDYLLRPVLVREPGMKRVPYRYALTPVWKSLRWPTDSMPSVS